MSNNENVETIARILVGCGVLEDVPHPLPNIENFFDVIIGYISFERPHDLAKLEDIDSLSENVKKEVLKFEFTNRIEFEYIRTIDELIEYARFYYDFSVESPKNIRRFENYFGERYRNQFESNEEEEEEEEDNNETFISTGLLISITASLSDGSYSTETEEQEQQ